MESAPDDPIDLAVSLHDQAVAHRERGEPAALYSITGRVCVRGHTYAIRNVAAVPTSAGGPAPASQARRPCPAS
jgi:hypothetical protein